MDRSQRDVNNNMVKRRIDDRDRDDDDDDGGSARKRPKFGHSDTSDVTVVPQKLSEENSGVAVGSGDEPVNEFDSNHKPVILVHSVLEKDEKEASEKLLTDIDMEFINEVLAEYGGNIEHPVNVDGPVQPAVKPDDHRLPQFADLNHDCVMEILKRFDINDLASIAHTNKSMKDYAENVFKHTHRGYLALNYIDGEEAAFLRTLRTFGPLATSMSITDTRDEDNANKCNTAIMVVAYAMTEKVNWNIQTIELNAVDIDFDLLPRTDQLRVLSLFTEVNELAVSKCRLLRCNILFAFLKKHLTDLSINDCHLDFCILHQYSNLNSLKLKFMGEYCDGHKDFQHDLFHYLLMPNFSIKKLVLMSSNFDRQDINIILLLLPDLNELTLNIEEEMDLLPLAGLFNLETLTLFGNRGINVGPLMQELSNHPSITTVHLNNVQNGAQFATKTTINFEH